MEPLRFGLLGPLEVTGPAGPVPVRGPKQRALLAALLLDEGRFVPVDVLLRALWDDDPPDSAVAQLQTRVWRLRRSLAAGSDPADPTAIETEPDGAGYRIVAAHTDVAGAAADAERARELRRAGRPDEAVAAFEAALARWRGPVLGGGVPGELAAAVARLDDERAAVVADLAEAELAAGRAAGAAARLRPFVAEHPLDERARELLMRALAATGRTGEALESYRDGRAASVDQLGIEPGPALRRLHEQLLAGDEPAEPAGPDAPPTAPEQLPPDVADFVGRQEALAAGARLDGVLSVSGPAGSGKTAFAVHLAHRLRDRFPDGRLFVDLHGVERPVDPADVLTRFLRALGEDPRTVPEDPDERAARYRERTAGRRLLVVLDDAAGEAQVRPLLPGGDGCAVVVTSRPRLAALEGALVLDLPVFAPDEAAELLARVAGGERTRSEPAACAELVELCGRLPLAIRVAAARLVARPHWTVRRLADELADERGRLDALAAGDLEVRAGLALGYAALDPPEQRAFRLLGALDVPDLAAWLATALLDGPEEPLDRLVEARLLEADPAGRYRLHDLVRAYARELADDETPAAVARALAACLGLADAAADALPGGYRRDAAPTAPRRPVPGDPAALVEDERAVLVAAVHQAVSTGDTATAADLALALSRFLELREHLAEWAEVLDAARPAATGRRAASLDRARAELHLARDRYADALACAAAALEAFRAEGDEAGEQHAARAAGTACRMLGRTDDAVGHLDRALQLATTRDDRPARAQILHNLGVVHRGRGERDRAAERHREALALFTAEGDRFGEAYVSLSLGLVTEPAEAEAHLLRSVELCRLVDHRHGEALARGHLGELRLRQGDLDRAEVELRAATAACREVGDGPGEAVGLRRLAELAAARGAQAPAGQLRHALRLLGEAAVPGERERILALLAGPVRAG